MHFCSLGGLETCIFGDSKYVRNSHDVSFWLQVKTGLLSQIPLGDFGDPIDIAEAVAFLACERYFLKL